jgi:hypothetical protein
MVPGAYFSSSAAKVKDPELAGWMNDIYRKARG